MKEHLLWQLNRLCNIDKHRRIPTDATIIDFNFPDFPRKFISLAKFDPDAEIISVPLGLKDCMKINPMANLNVTFGDSHEGIRCDLARLEQMHEFVAQKLIPQFASFF